MKNPHSKAIQILSDEYKRLGGIVFAEYYRRHIIETHGTDEQKKTLESEQFMNALFTGGKINDTWELQKMPEYTAMGEIVKSINALGETK